MTSAAEIELVELSPGDVEAGAADLAQLLLDAHASGMALGLRAPLDLERAAGTWRATAALLDPEHRVMLGARRDGMLVGVVQIVRAPAENGAHRAEIVRFAVRADQRGKGVGRALLEAATHRARDMGLTLLWLSTHAGTDSDRIYERLGWTRMGTMPGYSVDPAGVAVASAFYYLEL